MRKTKLLMLTAALSLLLGMETLAAGSSSGSIQVDTAAQTATVKTESGDVVEAQVIPQLSGTSQTPVSEEEAKAILGTERSCSVYMMDVSLIMADTNEKVSLNGSLTLQFSVPNVNPGSKVVVRHWRDDGQIEDLSAEKGDGFIRVTFTSLSPIAILVENPAAAPEPAPAPSNPEPDASATYAEGESYGDVRVLKTGTLVTVIRPDGEVKETIVHPYLDATSKTVTQAQAQKILGTKSACGIYAFDLSIVDAAGDYSRVTLKEGAVKVTFYVPGVTSSSNVVVRHWINGSDKYEDLPVALGSGTVTATFTSFSPVVIMVAQDGVPAVTAAAGSSVRVSPKTAETSMIYVVEAMAVLSLLGFAVMRRKGQA